MVSQLEKQLNLQKSQNSTVQSAQFVNGVLARKSLLFDSREIMTVTKDMVFAVGKQGLSQLSDIDQVFGQFAETIFSESSKGFHYYTQDKDSRTKLQHEINTFLILLSPYMMIKAAMYCIEWLIYQYHIDELCWDYLIHSILPYHDSKLFPRIIQLINFDMTLDHGEKRIYSFLKVLQKEPIPMPKKSLVSHASRNPGLLVAISNYVKCVDKLLLSNQPTAFINSNDNNLNNYDNMNCHIKWEAYSAVYSFYASLAYASIDDRIVNSENNTHIRNQLLYNVIDGLTVDIDIIRSANVLILCKMLDHTQLNQKQFDFVVKKIIHGDDIGYRSLDMTSLHVLIKLSETHPTYSFSTKLCELLLATNTLEAIHQLLPPCKKDTSALGVLMVNSIENFLSLITKETGNIVDQLTQLFFGWKSSKSLLATLVDTLIVNAISSTSPSSLSHSNETNASTMLLIELEKCVPSIVVDRIGAKLLECRQNSNMTHYQHLYDLLSLCLTRDSMWMSNAGDVDQVNLPLLLCVYNSNKEIRKSAVLSIRDYLNNPNNRNNITQSSQLKLKEILEFFIYKNPSDIVLLVLSEIQPVDIFAELFNATERVHIFKYIMECVLSNPQEWLEAIVNVTPPSPTTPTNNNNDANNDDLIHNHSLTLDMLSVMIMILHKYKSTKNNQHKIYQLIHFASCLLPQVVVDIFREQTTNKNFFANVITSYSQKYEDFMSKDYITHDFSRLKPLSKYTALCAIAQLNKPPPPPINNMNSMHRTTDDVIMSVIVDELNQIKIDPSMLITMETITSWEDIVSMMDVVNYPIALLYSLKSILTSSNESNINNKSKINDHNDSFDFMSNKKLLNWLCETYHNVDTTAINNNKIIKQWIALFFSRNSTIKNVSFRLEFLRRCIFHEYSCGGSSINSLMDLYELMWHMDAVDNKYLTSCFLLMLKHRDERIRTFVFNFTIAKSTSDFSNFYNYLAESKKEIINSPQNVDSYIAELCGGGGGDHSKTLTTTKTKRDSNKLVITIVQSILQSVHCDVSDNNGILSFSTLQLLSIIKNLHVKKCILDANSNVDLVVQLVNNVINHLKHVNDELSSYSRNSSSSAFKDCLNVLAQLVIKLWVESHQNKLSSLMTIFDQVILDWALLPANYSCQLFDNLNEPIFKCLSVSTLNHLATMWLNQIGHSRHSSGDLDDDLYAGDNNELVLKSLRKFPLTIAFIESYIKGDDTSRLDVIIELMQAKNSIVNPTTTNSSKFLSVLFGYIDVFFTAKKYYQLQLLLNCCESILNDLSLHKDSAANICVNDLNLNLLLPLLDCSTSTKSNKSNKSKRRSINASLSDGESDSWVDESTVPPNFKLAALNILKYTSVLMPASVLGHLVTIFISIGNDDFDNFNTMATIQAIIKQVVPLLFVDDQDNNNNRKDTNTTNLNNEAHSKVSIEHIINAVVDAFEHIPPHRHLTLCTTLFDVIDLYEPQQKYASMFIELVLYRKASSAERKRLCIDFFYSRPTEEQQINILLGIYDHFIDVASRSRCVTTAETTCHSSSHSQLIQFDTSEACIKHQINVLSVTCHMIQDSQNAALLYPNEDGPMMVVESPIYLLLEKIYIYSHYCQYWNNYDEMVAVVMSPELKKSLRYIVTQCDQCVVNLMARMSLGHKLTCISHAIASTTGHVRRRLMEHLIEVVSKYASKIATNKTHMKILMEEIIAKLVGRAEQLVLVLCSGNKNNDDDSNQPMVEELQLSMCSIKCIVHRIFNKHSSKITDIDDHMQMLVSDVFNRLFKVYDVRSQLPLNAFVTINLTVCELAALLSVNVLPHLFTLLSVLVDLTSNQCTFEHSQRNAKLSLLWFEANVTSIGKLFASVGNLFTSQLYALICCVLQSAYDLIGEFREFGGSNDVDVAVRKFTLNLIVDNISKNSDSRVYLPVLEKIICEFIPTFLLSSSSKIHSINFVVDIITPTFIQHADTISYNSQLLPIYFMLLDHLSTHLNSDNSCLILIDQINDKVAASFCEFILRHSGTQSHEIISLFYQWTTTTTTTIGGGGGDNPLESWKIFIFFYVVNLLSSKLKSIMLLFTPIYFQHAVDYIDDVVVVATSKGKESINLTCFLTTTHIVQSLTKCFDVDRSGFINEARMTSVIKPLFGLISIASTTFGSNFPKLPAATTFANVIIGPAIAALVTCTKENKFFSTIHSQMLQILRTQSSNKPGTCDILIVLEHFYKAVGDIYSTLLPELSPVLMELNDEDSETFHCNIDDLVNTISVVSGQSYDYYT